MDNNTFRWKIPKTGNGWILFVNRFGPARTRELPGWIEWKSKLKVWDAVIPGPGYYMRAQMAGAKRMRTDDLFAAIGFIMRGGQPGKDITPPDQLAREIIANIMESSKNGNQESPGPR